MNQTVLIVEDEQSVAELLSDYLKASGYATHIIENGVEVETWVRLNSPDLILLDLMLPGKDGVTVCKEIRMFSHVPIIMATARVDEIDRLLGLEFGADDYICKPFSPREVVARVKAVLRRTQGVFQDSEKLVKVDRSGSMVLINGQDLGLTLVEFHLFITLYSRPGRIFSRLQLIDFIYQDHRMVNDRTIDSHIKKLRHKISQLAPGIDLIHSVYGIGYKYEG
jgi:two-component system response regulator BaeR